MSHDQTLEKRILKMMRKSGFRRLSSGTKRRRTDVYAGGDPVLADTVGRLVEPGDFIFRRRTKIKKRST